MNQEFWIQQKETPLFPDVIWSRPETKHGAGKLLIVGGSAGAMSHLSSDFAAATQAGAGTIHLLVPESLRKVTSHIPHINYAPSTPSGSFARKALVELLELSKNVDAVLLSGDMGKNSETSLLLETFLTKYDGLLFVTSEGLESFAVDILDIANRPGTTIFFSLKQLQTLGIQAKLESAITSDITRPKLAEILHEISEKIAATIVLNHAAETWVAHKGRVAACKGTVPAAASAVWQLQQPTRPFESLVSSTYTGQAEN